MHSSIILAGGLLSVASAIVLPRAPVSYADTWESNGCVTEPLLGRLLIGPLTQSTGMTLDVCANFCVHYQYFGTEDGFQCYCGNFLASGGTSVDVGECNIPCNGDDTEDCGAFNIISLYAKIDVGGNGGGGNGGGGNGGGGNGGGGFPPFPPRPTFDNHAVHTDNSDSSINIDDSVDNSSFLSPIIKDKSRTDSADIANGIANGDHKLSTDTTVKSKQDNEQNQAAGVVANPNIGIKNGHGH